MNAQEIIDEAATEQRRIDGIKGVDNFILQRLAEQGIELYWDSIKSTKEVKK